MKFCPGFPPPPARPLRHSLSQHPSTSLLSEPPGSTGPRPPLLGPWCLTSPRGTQTHIVSTEEQHLLPHKETSSQVLGLGRGHCGGPGPSCPPILNCNLTVTLTHQLLGYLTACLLPLFSPPATVSLTPSPQLCSSLPLPPPLTHPPSADPYWILRNHKLYIFWGVVFLFPR